MMITTALRIPKNVSCLFVYMCITHSLMCVWPCLNLCMYLCNMSVVLFDDTSCCPSSRNHQRYTYSVPCAGGGVVCFVAAPWQSMDADTSPSKPRSTLATPILVRHRSKMIARRTNSARVLRWYSSASGSSSPIVHAYDPVERGSSLPVGLPRSAAIDVAGGLEDSMSSADEAHSSATRRKRSISEPVGIASRECRSLSPVIGSPNDAPVEARRILESSAGMAGLATDSAQWSLKRSDDCEESKSLSPRVSLSTGLIATTTPESNGEDADDSGVTATPSPASLDSPACASPFFFSSRIQRCQVSLEKLDEKRSTALLGKRLVGKVMSPSFRPSGKSSIISLKLKQVSMAHVSINSCLDFYLHGL